MSKLDAGTFLLLDCLSPFVIWLQLVPRVNIISWTSKSDLYGLPAVRCRGAPPQLRCGGFRPYNISQEVRAGM